MVYVVHGEHMAVVRFGVAPEGERTNPEGRSIRNNVLLAASDDEFLLIRPHLQFAWISRIIWFFTDLIKV